MQAYALDLSGKRVFCEVADKSGEYVCIECHKKMRLRGGVERRLHFYHVEESKSCFLSKKSEEHLEVQFYIQNAIGLEDAGLEVHFSEISRISDVAWFGKKIVFEVQVSPLDANEGKQRTSDYEKIGWNVVWIVHEKTFWKRKVVGFEKFLQSHTHYFTDIRKGTGSIFDRPLLINQGKNETKKYKDLDVKYPVALNFPERILPLSLVMSNFLPRILKMRLSHWKLSFKGDLIHLASACSGSCFSDGPMNQHLKKMLEIEGAIFSAGDPFTWKKKQSESWIYYCERFSKKILKTFFVPLWNYFLEKSTR